MVSSLGLLATDLKHDYVVTMIRRTDNLDLEEVEAVFQSLQKQGRDALQREGIAASEMAFQRQVEMRYVGQLYVCERKCFCFSITK